MENKLRQVCGWINDVAEQYKTIEQNKMSSSELKILFEIVDVKQKGYLDLNDVYELVGKVTQDQLFRIFKFIDTERTGEIRLEDLETSLGNPQLTSKNISKEYIFPKFYSIIDTLKDRPLLANNYKQKYGFTASNLKATYQYISNLVQSNYLSSKELFTVLKSQSIKYGIKWGLEHEKTIKQFLPDAKISEAKFVHFLSSETLQVKAEVQEESLLQGIETQISNSFKHKNSQIKVNPVQLNKSSFGNQSNPSIILKKSNNFFESASNQPPSFRPKPKQMISLQPKQIDSVYRKQFNVIEGGIKQALSSIQNRRQKLRTDSLQRKKLIEDVMNRKREFCAVSNTTTTSPQANTCKGSQGFYRRDNQSFQKDNTKSYLSKTFQKETNHFKQQSQYQNSFLFQRPYMSPEFYTASFQPQPNYIQRGKSINDFRMNLEGQLSSSINHKQFCPITPMNSRAKQQISQIFSKYSNYGGRPSKAGEEEQITLKQLCKSKSGFIYSQLYANNQRVTKEPNQVYQMKDYKYQRQLSSSKANMSKENVLKRAEQEANRKIEQIQRKARMKVLQKKSMARNINKQEWGKTIKKGCYY